MLIYVPFRYCDHSLHTDFDTVSAYSLCGNVSNILTNSAVDKIGSVNEVTTPLPLFTLPGQTDTYISYYLIHPSDTISTFTFSIWFSLNSLESPLTLVSQEGYFSIELGISTNGAVYIFTISNSESSVEFYSISSNELVSNGWHHLSAFLDGSKVHLSLDQNSAITDFQVTLNTSQRIIFGLNLDGQINLPVFANEVLFSDFPSFISCLVTCGEYITYEGATNQITAVENVRGRSLFLRISSPSLSPAIDTYSILEEALKNVFYENILDEPSSYPRQVNYRVSDSSGYGEETRTQLNPILLNDKEPIIDLNGDDDGTFYSTTFVENSGGVSLIPASATLFDRDSGVFSLTAITVINTNPIDSSNEILFALNLPSEYTAHTQEHTLTVTASVAKTFAEWTEDILRGNVIYYLNNFIEPTIGTRVISLTVLETAVGINFTDTAYIYVSILPVNDEPVIDLNLQDLSSINTLVEYSEGDMDIVLLTPSSLSITDSDNLNLLSAVIWLSPTPDGNMEYIDINSDSVVLNVTNNDTYILITGNASTSAYEDILLSLEYTNLNEEDPNDSSRMVYITIFDTDQQPSETAIIYIDFSAINDAPILDLDSTSVSNTGYYSVFVEETGCVPIVAPSASIVDVDSSMLVNLTVSFREGNIDVLETLNANDTDGLLVVSDNAGGVTLSGDRYVEDYVRVLRSVMYCNSGDEPRSDVIRNVTISVYDKEGRESNVALSEVMVERVNDNPNVTLGANNNASYGSSSEVVFAEPISVSDVDSMFFFRALIYIFYPYDGKDFEIITFEGDLGNQITSVGPNEVLSGEFAGAIFYNVTFLIDVVSDRVEEVISRIQYSNTANNPNTNDTRRICVSVFDVDGGASKLTCIVLSVNEPNLFVPQFLNELRTLTVSENTPVSDVIDTASASDNDQDMDLVYSIVSVTSSPSTDTTGLFTIDSSGNIILLQTLDAETVQSYELEIQVSDSGIPSQTAQAHRSFILSDANDVTPVFVSPLDCSIECTFCVDEGSSFTRVLSATDGDKTSPNNIISRYQVNSDQFSISSTGVLTSIHPIDYELSPLIYLVVGAVDGGVDPGPLTGNISVTICVADIDDEPPVITQRTNGVYVKGSDPVFVDQFLEVIDVDSEGLDQASVSITIPADPSSVAEDCTDYCFDRRLQLCQSTITPIDLLSLAVITNNVSGVFLEADPYSGSCPYIEVKGGSNGVRDTSLFGHGIVSANDLPTLVAQPVTIIAELYNFEGEGYLLSINEDGRRYLSVWLQRDRISVLYTDNTNRFQWKKTGIQPTLLSDDYWSLVVTIDPSLGVSTGAVHVYRDCVEITGGVLSSFSLGILSSQDLSIGQRFPSSRSRNRITAGIRNLYIIPSLLSENSINCFCPCQEYLDIRANLLPNTVDLSHTVNAIALSNRGTFADFVTAFRALQFFSFFNNPVTTGAILGSVSDSRSLRVYLDDPSGNRNTAVLQVYVANSPLPLTIDLDDSIVGNNAFTSFTEDTAAAAIFENLGLLFKEGENARPPVSQVTVTLLNPLDGTDEFFSAQNYSGVVADVSIHEIVLTGPGAPIGFKNALQTVTYFNQKNLPDTTTREVQVMFTSVDNTVSDPSTLFLSLSQSNDCPQIYLNNALDSSISLDLVEGSSPLLLFPDLSFEDTDGDYILEASLEIDSSTYIQGEDLITFNSNLASRVGAALLADQRVLLATVNATLSDYQDLFKTIRFQSTSNPLLDSNGAVVTNNDKRLVLELIDTSGSNFNCPRGYVTLNFVPVDAPPVILLPYTVVNFTEESNATVLVLWDLTLSDSDSLVIG